MLFEQTKIDPRKIDDPEGVELLQRLKRCYLPGLIVVALGVIASGHWSHQQSNEPEVKKCEYSAQELGLPPLPIFSPNRFSDPRGLVMLPPKTSNQEASINKQAFMGKLMMQGETKYFLVTVDSFTPSSQDLILADVGRILNNFPRIASLLHSKGVKYIEFRKNSTFTGYLLLGENLIIHTPEEIESYTINNNHPHLQKLLLAVSLLLRENHSQELSALLGDAQAQAILNDFELYTLLTGGDETSIDDEVRRVFWEWLRGYNACKGVETKL